MSNEWRRFTSLAPYGVPNLGYTYLPDVLQDASTKFIQACEQLLTEELSNLPRTRLGRRNDLIRLSKTLAEKMEFYFDDFFTLAGAVSNSHQGDEDDGLLREKWEYNFRFRYPQHLLRNVCDVWADWIKQIQKATDGWPDLTETYNQHLITRHGRLMFETVDAIAQRHSINGSVVEDLYQIIVEHTPRPPEAEPAPPLVGENEQLSVESGDETLDTEGGKERGPTLDKARADRSRRGPNLAKSQERLALLENLAHELATVKQEIKGYCTSDILKRKHPKFILWTLIEDSQIKALVDGEEFTPKRYAENLTLAKFGLTSRETLKKDRQKLSRAEKRLK
jgi:hypothetical protein